MLLLTIFHIYTNMYIEMKISNKVSKYSDAEKKIALFRSLFRGREDVFPLRFESKRTGKSGYQPACANEWIRGLCDKRAVKCVNCPNRHFVPVTDDIIRQHLLGKSDAGGKDFVMGVYPMLMDESCFFLAADFDKKSWQDDVIAMAETCHTLDIPVAIERSRSGNGAHLWLFFKEAINAGAARKLGTYILTETMEQSPGIGLDSYDRFFPNQDTLPRGGFGNLIALPLQKQARNNGNSVFVNDDLLPFEDQWEFLSNIKKIESKQVEDLVHSAERKRRVIGVRFVSTDENDVKPWSLPPSRKINLLSISEPLPERVDLVFGNEVYIPKQGLAPQLQNRLIRIAAFQNPEFYKAQAMRLPTFDKPRIIACAEIHSEYIALPRGCLDEVKSLFRSIGIKYRVQNKCFAGKLLDVSFCGELRLAQKPAAKAMMAHNMGVLSATTAFGKTVLAAWIIAQRGVNTLIVVHRKQLMEQWRERLSAFLDLPIEDIGRIGGGYKKSNGMLDVALIQSLVRKGVVDDCVGNYGQFIVDECHHIPAVSFEQVTRRAKAKYILGLSATVVRKDGHHPIIAMQCGPVRYRVSAKQQAKERPFTHSVIVRPTSFYGIETSKDDTRMQFNELYQALITDEKRNQLICSDVIRVLKENRSPIVLTERREHLEVLQKELSKTVPNIIVLSGGMAKKELKETLLRLAAISDKEPFLLLSTGQFIGEGFDNARLDTLFLTMPVSWRGTIAQYAGRLHRLYASKREVRIYDYADLNVPILSRMFDRRCVGYEAVGYSIMLPASAVPGWPQDVPLPVDPEWKRDYAASVQRLIRDGVDAHLGNLFVYAARKYQPDAEGVERARSSSEAFLYRRLETLPETKGRFNLNIQLAIPFNEHGQMEVDLLCEEYRIAIELDGPHHFTDSIAYRRDRRKDQLLQENGYFVLRFLTEDVGKYLSEILDFVLRTISHRRNVVVR